MNIQFQQRIQFINDFQEIAELRGDRYALNAARKVRRDILRAGVTKENIERGYFSLIGMRIENVNKGE